MLDEGLNSIRNQGEVSFGKTKTGHIAFADDLVIFANNDKQINQKIKILARKLQELGLVKRKDFSFAFLDMRKAFDSIKPKKLIRVLAKNSIPRKTLVLIADLYTGNLAELQNGDTIRLQRGVIQGDPHSYLTSC